MVNCRPYACMLFLRKHFDKDTAYDGKFECLALYKCPETVKNRQGQMSGGKKKKKCGREPFGSPSVYIY